MWDLIRTCDMVLRFIQQTCRESFKKTFPLNNLEGIWTIVRYPLLVTYKDCIKGSSKDRQIRSYKYLGDVRSMASTSLLLNNT